MEKVVEITNWNICRKKGLDGFIFHFLLYKDSQLKSLCGLEIKNEIIIWKGLKKNPIEKCRWCEDHPINIMKLNYGQYFEGKIEIDVEGLDRIDLGNNV